MSKAPKTLTHEESTKMMSELLCPDGSGNYTRRSVRNHAMGRIMLEAGLRVGELIRLERSDLQITEDPVHSLLVRAETSKTKRERVIPLSNGCQDALRLLFPSWKLSPQRLTIPNAFFNIARLTPLTIRQVQRIIETAALRAFGRKANPHILRHTFASRLMRITNVRVVQELLGHKRLSSTQIYTHPNATDLHRAIHAVEDRINDLESVINEKP